MELHHSKHHKAYVDGANAALTKLAELREKGDYAALNGLEKNLAFHLGGHMNHSVFWKNMRPDGGDKPEGELAAAIDEYFGGFDEFQAHFNANANAIQGSGWSILAWDTIGERPHIMQLFDQQGNIPVGQIPLLHARHVGARLLPAVQERQGRLRQGLVERRQLAGRRRSPRARQGHQGTHPPGLTVRRHGQGRAPRRGGRPSSCSALRVRRRVDVNRHSRDACNTSDPGSGGSDVPVGRVGGGDREGDRGREALVLEGRRDGSRSPRRRRTP